MTAIAPPVLARRSAAVAPAPDPELSRALHDTVLQSLELIAGGGPGGAFDAAELSRLAADAAGQLRALIEPGMPAAGLLAEEIARVVERARRMSRSDISLILGATDGSVGPTDVHALTGAAAEALNNARKHAGATRVVVFCEETCGEALCTVRDDGAGMDPGCAEGFGIAYSLRARMREVDGAAHIESAPGAGTKVILTTHRKVA